MDNQYDIYGGITPQKPTPAAIANKGKEKGKGTGEEKPTGTAQAMAAAFKRMAESGFAEVGSYERVAKFKNNSITQVDVYRSVSPRPHNPRSSENLLNQAGNGSVYNGYLSPATRRYVEKILSVWLTSIELANDLKAKSKEHNRSEVFPTFVTLTLPAPQMHSDNEIKQNLLNPFIKWLQGDDTVVYQRGKRKGQKKGFGVKGYFWRAEPQKNGNVHFHIICDRYIHWERIREKWNQCLERLDYITFYGYAQQEKHKYGFEIDPDQKEVDMASLRELARYAQEKRQMPKNTHPLFEKYLKVAVDFGRPLSPKMIEQAAIEKQEKAYENGLENGFSNPNSTDIHAIRDLQSVTAYVVKYIAKKPTELPLAENEKVEFNEAFGRDMIHTYDYVTKPDGSVVWEAVEYHENIPQFEERKIGGRIWGCADLLRGFKPNEVEKLETDEKGLTYAVSEVEDETTEEVTVIKRPVHVMNFYTRTVGVFYRYMSRNGSELNFFTSDYELLDPECDKYLKDLTEKIGEKTIESISNMVGESFARMNGKIIPFRTEKMGFKSPGKDKNGKDKKAVVKHADVLKKFAPEIYKDYVGYYTHIYDCIYKQAI